MAKNKKNRYGSINSGQLSKGCTLCMQGKKMVVFVTGKCPKNCYFCPISSTVKGKDIIKANERRIRKLKEIITEAKEMRANGAGITGGEPLFAIKRACKIIKLLKKEFGKKFHIHLYTEGSLATLQKMKALEKAGLDEIRFHLFKDNGTFNRILPALKTKMQVTVEVPAIPTAEKEKELSEMISFMKDNGIKFLNLNEFEFSDSNFEKMKKAGFLQVHDFTYAVRASKETAMRLIKIASPQINVHFCPTFIKSGLQLRERLKRRALTIRKPFEKVNSAGFIEKAVIEGIKPATAKKILLAFRTKKKFLFYNRKKQRIETNTAIAKKVSKQFGRKAFFLTEYPQYNPWDFEKKSLE